MKKTLLFCILLSCSVCYGQILKQSGQKITNANANQNFGTSLVMSSDGNMVLISNGVDVWPYTFNGANLVRVGNKITAIRNPNDYTKTLGSISKNGQIAVIGENTVNGNTGIASVYSFDGANYQRVTTFTGASIVGTAFFGATTSVSADGSIILVAGPGDNASKGAVWAFSFTGQNCVPIGGKIVPSSISGFGSTMSLTGDGRTAIVGGAYAGNSVQLYTLSGSGFIPLGDKITKSYSFGQCVHISANGNYAYIGQPNGIGSVSILSFDGSNYAPAGTMDPNDYNLGQYDNSLFGTSIASSTDGKTVIIGGNYDDNVIGATWIFTFNGVDFVQAGPKLVGSGTVEGLAAQQGISIGISGDGSFAAVGGSAVNNATGGVWLFRKYLDQTITGFSLPAQKTFGDPPIFLAPTVTSAMPLTYEVDGPGYIAGNKLFFIGEGVLTVTAVQLGDNIRYNPSAAVVALVSVNGFNQAVKNSVNSILGINGTASGIYLTEEQLQAIINAAVTQALNSVTGINEAETVQETIVYPNPSKGNFILHSISNQSTLYISNAWGEIVLRHPLVYGSNAIQTDLPPGVYILRMGNERKKLIVEP